MSTYRPGDICWDVVPDGADDTWAVLIIAAGESMPLAPGRVLEMYDGSSFRPGCPPVAVERFAIVVPAPTPAP